MKSRYNVWVGGVEVNDYQLNYQDACKLADFFLNTGYDDVQLEEIKLIKIRKNGNIHYGSKNNLA